MTFLHKRVGEGSGSFGADLCDLREHNKRTLEEAAYGTKISERMLRSFEEDQIADIDDPAFAERHLLAYVRYLGGYEPYFLTRYRAKIAELKASRRTEQLLPRRRGVRGLDLFVGPHFLGVLGILFLALGLGGYVWWQARAMRVPPPLTVLKPVDGERIQKPSVVVQGKTMGEAYVTVNGVDAPVDADGNFSVTVDVRRGATVISVIARRRRGSESRVERRVVYDRPLPGLELLPGYGTSTVATSTPQ
jgi:hypothetical protein